MALFRKKKPQRMKGKLFTKQDDLKDLPPMVEVTGVHRTYESGAEPVRVLKGVSLKVQRGEMVALMGPSGSGKTTLLNVIGLLDTPDSGTVKFAGIDVTDLKRRKVPLFRQNEVGMIFQQKNLIPSLTAFENVYLPFRYARGKRKAGREQAREALRLVGMLERENHLPNQLSGGEQQRVAVARALVLSPAVVLADEPTGELDHKTSDDVMDLLQELNEQTGQTFVIVTHDHSVADRADRVLNMDDGKVVPEKRQAPRKRPATKPRKLAPKNRKKK
ncbi:MAG TPA: ABC transporter ATP-binding protein [Patescibacteria group bacterium]|jgi:putative ABC transport system ATP-binding protein